MKMCYKDKSRECNDTCAAHHPGDKHETSCLDLSTQKEAVEQIRKLIITSDCSAIHMKNLSLALNVVRETFKDALQI